MSENKKELHEQNLILNRSEPNQSIYMEIAKPTPYQSDIKHMKLPFGKFNDPDIFLDAYMRNGNAAMKSLCLAGISKELGEDWHAMLKIVKLVPEAMRQVRDEVFIINSRDFLTEALRANPQVFDFIHPEGQKIDWVIDAYARGMWESGCKYLDRDKGQWVTDAHLHEPESMIPTFKYAIHPSCDMKRFYSLENYQLAHEAMIKDGIISDAYRGDPRMFDAIDKYHPAIAYLQNARQWAQEHDPSLLKDYQSIEAGNISLHIDTLAERVKKNPLCHESIQIAEAVVYAQSIIEDINYPYIDVDKGDMVWEQQFTHPKNLIETIQNAEKEYYKEQGNKLQTLLKDDDKNWMPSTRTYIDTLMEMAENHPEMNVDKETMSAWWEQRAEDFKKLVEMEPMALSPSHNATVAYFEDLANKHPEMRIGEQLSIEGFDQEPNDTPNISDNR